MTIEDRMSKPITVAPSDNIEFASELMQQNRIHRLIVLDKGTLVGMVSDRDILKAAPSSISTLSAHEAAYLMSKVTVKQVMKKKVVAITKDTTFEEAARIMVEEDTTGLPVLEAGKVVGIVTRTDILKMMIEVFGAGEYGTRVSFVLDDQPGALGKICAALSEKEMNIISFGTFGAEEPGKRTCTIKISGERKAEVIDAIRPLATKIIDIREV